jgi:hypothetical protein
VLQVLGQDTEGASQLRLLDLVSTVKCDLFGVGDDPRVHVAEVALFLGFLGHQLAKSGRDELEHQGRENDDTRDDGRAGDQVRVAALHQVCQRDGHQEDIEHGLGDLAVEVGDGAGDGFDVVGEALGAVVETAIEDGYLKRFFEFTLILTICQHPK